MAIVFDEVSAEITGPARGGEPAASAAGGAPREATPPPDAEALHEALAHRERLLARLSAD